MTEPVLPSKPRKRGVWRYLLGPAVFAVVTVGGLLWYTTTDSFRNMVKNRVVAELERVTGGRAEFGSFHIIPLRFRVEIRDLTIHGNEPAGEIPYVHVDSLIAQVKIISVLSAEFGFRSVVVDHPTIHILVYPDGSTNQPHPKLRAPSSAKADIQRLFALSIGRFEVRHGRFLWNDRETPLDFAANDLSADMTYSLLHRRYDSNLLLGKIETRFDGFRPIAWMAEAHFALTDNGLDVRSFRANSGRSHIEATGKLTNFQQPAMEGKYTGSIDLEEASAAARRPEVRHGVLELAGTGKWSAADFSSSGKLQLKDLDWRNGGLWSHSATLGAQYSVTPQRLVLSQIEGKALGGSIAGEAELTNWRSSAPAKGGNHRQAVEQKGLVRLKFKDGSVAEAADILSGLGLPLNKLNMAGSGDGTLDAHWLGSLAALETSVALDISPPARVSANQLPVTAHGSLTYRASHQELDVENLTASTRATQVHASGTLASGSVLKLSVTTTDLNEWQPALHAFKASLPIPASVHGRASFNGTLAGRFPDVALAGSLQAEDFDTVVPATSRTAERNVHWDSLSATIQLSQRLVSARNGSLHQGATAITFDVSAGLSHGHVTDQSAIDARVDMRKTDVAAILALAGLNYPVTGVMDVHLTASGTKASLSGGGHIDLTNATLSGKRVERLESDVQFSGEEVRLSNALVAFYDSQLTGSGTYNFSTGAMRLDVDGKNFDLARIPQLRSSRFDLQGRADFSAHASGTLAAPAVTATVHLRQLTVSHQALGAFTLNAATRGEEVHITGQSQFEKADLAMDGTVRLRGDWLCDINVRFKELDVASLLLADWNSRLKHSALTGQVRVQGPLLRPGELKVSGTLDSFTTSVQDIDLHNDGPIRFSVSNQLLQVEQFHITGQRTDLTGSGIIHLTGNRELDLRAHGQANLRLIESFNHDFDSYGQVTVDVTVAGTVSSPIAQGRVQIENGRIAYLDLPSGLSEMNGTLVFNQNRVQIESLTARSGGGSVTLGGFATVQNGRLAFDFNGHGEGVRLRYPPGISSTANADLRFAGTTDSSTLSGNITVTKLSVTPGFDFGAYLAHSAQSSTLSETSPLLSKIRLDVHIVTTPELQMQTTQLRLSGDADLRLRGTAAKPALLGRAEVIEGDVYFNGTKYHLERGEVSFIKPVSIEPVFDLQMSTRVRDYDITVSLNGSLNKLTMSYRSEPPLPEADIVALLALGRTREESAQLQQSSQSPFNQEASSAILSQALNTVVSNRVQRLFGGSRIKIDPQGLNSETNPQRGPQVTIEQQVTHNLTLTYSTAVSQSSEQIIQVEYNLTHNVSIIALRDQNGVVSFDVRVRQRRK